MPNYVKVEVSASQMVIDALMGEPGEDGKPRVDFNRVIPEPINLERGNCTGHHAEGVICWYTWRRLCWGTKWNAGFTVRHADDLLEFQTAWSVPLPVLVALSMLHPAEPIAVRYADEDYGQNLGEFTLQGGAIIADREFAMYSDDARDFAALLWHGKTYAELQAEWEAADAAEARS